MQVSKTETQAFAFIPRCNLCSLPETEVERDDNVRMRLGQIHLKIEELLSLSDPLECLVDGRTEAALAMGEESLAIVEKMGAEGNGRAILQLPEDLCAYYQFASMIEVLTDKGSKRKTYKDKALMTAQSLSKKHVEETQMKIKAINAQIERIRVASVYAKILE